MIVFFKLKQNFMNVCIYANFVNFVHVCLHVRIYLNLLYTEIKIKIKNVVMHTLYRNLMKFNKLCNLNSA